MKLLQILSALLALVLLTGCQTSAATRLTEKLKAPCPEVTFVAGKIGPQVVKLKTEYEICKEKHKEIVEILE